MIPSLMMSGACRRMGCCRASTCSSRRAAALSTRALSARHGCSKPAFNGHVPQPGDEGVLSCRVVGDRETCGLRQQQHVEPVLRHIDSNEALLYHPRVPSLLMRARALATVREWKKRLEHQAHSRPCHRGGYGLPVATGAVL